MTSFGLCRPSSGQNIYKNLNGGVYNVLLVNVMGSHLQSVVHFFIINACCSYVVCGKVSSSTQVRRLLTHYNGST